MHEVYKHSSARGFINITRMNKPRLILPFIERTPVSRGVFFMFGRWVVAAHIMRRGV